MDSNLTDKKRMDHKLIFEQALKQWGDVLQYDMVVEECAELIHAINAYKRGRATKDQVLDEIADVQIMLNQMRAVFGMTETHVVYHRKLNRLYERLIDYGWTGG